MMKPAIPWLEPRDVDDFSKLINLFAEAFEINLLEKPEKSSNPDVEKARLLCIDCRLGW